MNAERLNELVIFLISQDREWKIQQQTEAVGSALDSLQNNPSDPGTQQNASRALDTLDAALDSFLASVTPARSEAIREIGGSRWFSKELGRQIREGLLANPAMPAVATEMAQKAASERSSYLETMGALSRSLSALGIEAYKTSEDRPEIGFTLPRSLFDNNLPGLQHELSEISRVLDIFSEASVGEKTDVEVREISTSDPTFFFAVVAPVAVAFAGSITWLLNTWKQALEIRNLVKQAKDTGFKDEDLKVFKDKIGQTIDEAIDERVGELVPADRSGPRDNELRNGLRYAHRALLARIERGMTVEIRFLPPPENEDEYDEGDIEGTKVREDREAAYTALASYVDQMDFPAPTEKPILQIPKQPSSKANKKPDDGAEA